MLVNIIFLALLTLVSSETDDELLAKAHNHFALKLLKELANQNHPSSNVFFSPTSIAAAFGMVYAGARGSSEAELTVVLGHSEVGLTEKSRLVATYKKLIEPQASPNVTLEVANIVLVHKNFNIAESYRKQLHDVFDAELRSVDFANEGPRVTAEVNAWARGKTRGKIDGILPEVQPLEDVNLFILNAVRFKGSWLNPFDPSKTEKKPFLNLGTTEVSKPAMYLLKDLFYARLDSLHAAAVDIPYSGDMFSLVILLPDSPTGLAALRDGQSHAVLEDVGKKLSPRPVSLSLPKFGISLRYDLVPAMRALGLNVAFASEANFTGIRDSPLLRISGAVHKPAVEVK